MNRFTAAALLATGLLTACSTTVPPSNTEAPTSTTNSVPVGLPTGLVLPEGIKDPAGLAAALRDYSGYVVVDTETTPVDGPKVVSRVEWHPDGSRTMSYSSPSTYAYRKLADGTMFTDQDGTGNWVKEPQTFWPEEGIFGMVFNDVAGEDSVEATATGYLYHFNGAVDFPVTEFVVNQDRVLVQMIESGAEGTPFSTSTFSYPETLPTVVAPDNYVDRADLNGPLAENTLREAAAAVTAVGIPTGEITADMLTAELMRTNPDMNAFVDIEMSYDTATVGFANNGTSIELVVSDGIANCYRTTITGELSSGIVTDQNGAMSDLGFTCGTTIVNNGPQPTNPD